MTLLCESVVMTPLYTIPVVMTLFSKTVVMTPLCTVTVVMTLSWNNDSLIKVSLQKTRQHAQQTHNTVTITLLHLLCTISIEMTFENICQVGSGGGRGGGGGETRSRKTPCHGIK